MKKILFVSHSSGLYGSERSLYDLVIELSKRGISVEVLVPRAGSLSDLFHDADISIIVWPYFLWIGKDAGLTKRLFRVSFNIFSSLVFRLIRCSKYDLVYSNTIASNFGLYVSLLTKSKHIWHIREFVQEDANAKFDFPISWVKQVLRLRTHLLIYNSHAVSKKFSSWYPSIPAVVIHNGMRIEKYSARNKGLSEKEHGIHLLMVSSLKREKGHFDAVLALSRLHRKFPDMRLLIVGGVSDKLYFSELQGLIRDVGLAQHIEFTGYQADPERYFLASDIFLMCSAEEAFGRVTIEAMACGCAVIGTNSGGTSEIIHHRQSGFLYKPGDVAALTDAIEEIAIDSNFRQQLTENGLQRAKAFSLENTVSAVEKEIRRLTDRNGDVR